MRFHCSFHNAARSFQLKMYYFFECFPSRGILNARDIFSWKLSRTKQNVTGSLSKNVTGTLFVFETCHGHSQKCHGFFSMNICYQHHGVFRHSITVFFGIRYFLQHPYICFGNMAGWHCARDQFFHCLPKLAKATEPNLGFFLGRSAIS